MVLDVLWVVLAYFSGIVTGGFGLFVWAARGVDAEEHYRMVREAVLDLEARVGEETTARDA